MRTHWVTRLLSVPICSPCLDLFTVSPELSRLAKIAKTDFGASFEARARSIFSEWVERLRCEELAEKLKQANAAVESAKPTEDT